MPDSLSWREGARHPVYGHGYQLILPEEIKEQVMKGVYGSDYSAMDVVLFYTGNRRLTVFSVAAVGAAKDGVAMSSAIRAGCDVVINYSTGKRNIQGSLELLRAVSSSAKKAESTPLVKGRLELLLDGID